MPVVPLRIPRRCPGRPRTIPDTLRGDKAYSAKAHRDNLRARGGEGHDPGEDRPAGQSQKQRIPLWSTSRLLLLGLQSRQRRQTRLQQSQKLSWTRHPLRPARPDQPKLHGPGLNRARAHPMSSKTRPSCATETQNVSPFPEIMACLTGLRRVATDEIENDCACTKRDVERRPIPQSILPTPALLAIQPHNHDDDHAGDHERCPRVHVEQVEQV